MPQAYTPLSGHHGGDLDVVVGGEVVYCHACTHEWFRITHYLVCPQCGSDVTEILVDVDDPSQQWQSSTASAWRFNVQHPGRSNSREAVTDPPARGSGGLGLPTVGHRAAILGALNHPVVIPGPTFGRAVCFARHRLNRHCIGHDPGPDSSHQRATSGSGVRLSLHRDIDGEADHPLSHDFGMSGLPRPESVTSGSPVPSYLVFSRIILWVDSSPAYSASSPASESALSSLDRQTVDQKTLETEGQAHCTVCLDDLKVGATGAILSCKHMFHEECIVRWLKEHNTCPICRRSVESRTRVRGASGQGPDNDSPDHSNHDVFPEYLEEQKDEDVGPSVGGAPSEVRNQGVHSRSKFSTASAEILAVILILFWSRLGASPSRVLLALDGITLLADRVVPLAIRCFNFPISPPIYPSTSDTLWSIVFPSLAILGRLLLVVHIFGFVSTPRIRVGRLAGFVALPAVAFSSERNVPWTLPLGVVLRVERIERDVGLKVPHSHLGPVVVRQRPPQQTKRFDETISQAMETSIRDLEAHPLDNSI
ncbi:hypothetical protein PCL_12095 [Purpureocillium lilacinum]|uniref:RING-type E3 ubiquitin transferase n=1 Tax=Purpureocillium lilacinum TaxID=33203 RepID=A0A2U3DPH6_PURLI|nr:hypothetical protein PCL_12095 [Purpureocillium lilacinum]